MGVRERGTEEDFQKMDCEIRHLKAATVNIALVVTFTTARIIGVPETIKLPRSGG